LRKSLAMGGVWFIIGPRGNVMKRTSFVIARCLSTIRDADNVVVINHGEIVEQGSHQQLLDKRGFYYYLYVSQFKGQAI
jgi:ATP-binding cassette, subfamily B, multidrug efflux pump